MRNLLKKNKKKNLIVKTFLIILLLVHTDFFLNSYLILLKDYHSRMENGYGYCDKQGYGFIQKYNNKYNLSNNSKIIINEQDYPNPGLFIDQFYTPKNYEYLIYINSKKIILNKNILEQEFNCYIIRND
tara:strand:- start:467 stop:853 length:387 start_codon:yes stop_codon:yes gene_type:complete